MVDDDNGIEDTYDVVFSNKPRRATFSIFLQIFEIYEHIRKVPINTKIKKSVLQLRSDVAHGVQLLKKNLEIAAQLPFTCLSITNAH